MIRFVVFIFYVLFLLFGRSSLLFIYLFTDLFIHLFIYLTAFLLTFFTYLFTLLLIFQDVVKVDDCNFLQNCT